MKKILFVLILSLVTAFTASAAPLYEETEERILTDGVNLKTIRRFYGDYALNINCVTADLKNKYLGFELLKHDGGSDKVQTVMNLAKEQPDTVAAINGDFFSAYKGDQNFSLGIEIKDGELLQSHINADMAAGFLKDNALSLSYLTFNGSVTSPDGTVMPLAHINKPTDYYGGLLMYTNEFNGGESPFLPAGVTALTVTDGIVSGKGVSLGGTVPIPENGYILVIDDNMTPFLEYKFNVEDNVELKVEVTPSIENVDTAFGGGTLLLKNGEKTPITHSVNGNNPRSVLGTNADGTVIYMITVDGRQLISRGVSLESLADICLELGCVNAINLDGGGSTALVGKSSAENELGYINKPTENRKVINALAIKSSATAGKTAGFWAEASAQAVLTGDSVKLTAVAYDKNYNKPTDSPLPKWVVSQGAGYVKDNVYFADGSGETVLDLYFNGKKTDSCSIYVIDSVSGIKAEKHYTLSIGKETLLNGKVSVFDEKGKTATVNDITLLNPEYDESFISLTDGKITPLKEGGGQLRLSWGGASRCIKLTCGSYEADTDAPVMTDELMHNNADGFEFAVYASTKMTTLFDRIAYVHAMDILRSADASAVIGGEMPLDLTGSEAPLSAGGWSENNYDNLKLMSMKISSDILSRGQQWAKLSEALSGASQENVIILLNSPPKFAAEIDEKAFSGMLGNFAEKKNIFVVYNGDENFCSIYDGVRYISVADIDDESMLHRAIANTKYLSFNITEKGISYCFKNLYE